MLQKALLLIFLLVGCQEPKPPLQRFEGIAMTIPYTILTDTSLDESTAFKAIQEGFEEVNAHYNKFNPDSELSHINRLRKGERHTLSPRLLELLLLTEKIVTFSGGKFDPTIEPLQRLWKEGKVSSQEELAEAKKIVGWSKIHIEGHQIWKEQEGVQLDLGGIAKGYAVDLLFEKLRALGSQHLYVEWGGEIRVSKEHPSKRPWMIGIRNPLHEDKPLLTPLSNQAIATSGDYEQFYILNGERYTHIVDPKTGSLLKARADAPKSLTIIAPTCALADALATCFFFLDADSTPLEEFPGVILINYLK